MDLIQVKERLYPLKNLEPVEVNVPPGTRSRADPFWSIPFPG